jgi:hypothetical protein
MAVNKQRLPIIWNERIVGYLEDRKVEMWFHYGKWLPLDTAHTYAFLETIRTTGEAIVTLDGESGVVHAEPEETIDIKIWPGLLE